MEKNGKIINRVFHNSVISMVASVVAAMLGMVIDGIVIGRFLGPDSMAAYGLVTPIFNLATAISGIMATGAQVVCAQRIGAGDVSGARRAFSMCVVVTVILSAVIVAGVLAFRTQIAVILGARGDSAHLLPYAKEYLLGLVFALPAAIFLFEFNALMRLDGDANRVVAAVGVMTLLDIAGDLLNALVIRGGMLGMGLTTTISYYAALAIMLLHFTKKGILFRFTPVGLKLSDLKDILLTGSASAAGSVSSMLRNLCLNNIMVATVLSGTAVGALGVVNTVLGFTSSVMIGVGMTAAMIAGMILGERDRSAAEDLVRVTIRTSLIMGAVFGAAVFALSDVIASAFGSGDGVEMVRLAARGIRFYAVSMLFIGLNSSFIYYTQGIRRMAFSNACSVLENFVLVILPALLLLKRMDTDAVWLSFILGEGLTVLAICVLAAVQKRGVPNRARDFLFLPDGFGAREGDTFEVSIGKRSEVMSASRAIDAFCAEKGADSRHRMLLSLFVEELGGNVAEYGFTKGKDRSLDVRVVHAEDGWIIRFRDNCRAFDPTEWAELHRADDPAANIGIRMVCGMAKEVRYLNTMELNVMTLRI